LTHARVRPRAAWILCIAVWLSQAVGVFHGTLHAPGLHAAVHTAGHADASHGSAAATEGPQTSLGSHAEGDAACQILDGLGFAHPQVDGSPASTPWTHAAATSLSPGGCITPFAAAFDARGPPSRV
jgi:hypothetical protein